MSDNTETTTTAAAADATETIASGNAGAPEPAPGTTTPPESSEGQSGGNREAARYRVERNEARQERDTLQQRVQAMQRSEIERLAGQHLETPADLWGAAGVDTPDLLDDAGNVDAGKVAEVAQGLIAARPHWQKRSPATELTSTVTGNGRVDGGPPQPTWADVLQGKVTG